MTKQNILHRIGQLAEKGQLFSYNKWPEADSGKSGQYFEFEGWMAQVLDVARLIKQTVGSGALGMANRGRKAFQQMQPVVNQNSFDAAHGLLLEALKIARENVNDLWPDKPILENQTASTAVVFVSYSHIDRNTAESIIEVLDDLGIEHFLDVHQIEWGDVINDSVRRGLDEAGALLVILSPSSLKSQWVAFEVGYATARGRRILPYLTHPSLDPPGFIRDLSYTISPNQIREYFLSNPDWSMPISPSQDVFSERPAVPELSDASRQLLIEAAKDKRGVILRVRTRSGLNVKTNGREFMIGNEPREEARWEGAVYELRDFGFLEDRGYKGEVFGVTSPGYEMAEQLVKSE